jgi:ATP-dependent metalloprotease
MDPMNPKHAHAYMRELNRQNKFTTVVRLYQKSEMDFVKIDQQYLIRTQVDYARENLDILKLIETSRLKAATSGDVFLSLFWRIFPMFMKLGISLVAIYYLFDLFNMNAMMDEKFKFEVKTAQDIKTRLDDVMGIDEIKDEVKDLIKMVKNPDKYRDKGSKLHKGVMLFGEPGTGKTLLARAIAGESGVNFIFCSGSDFDEMYAGVGAKRVR